MEQIILIALVILSIAGCNNAVPVKNEVSGIVGHWYYNLKESRSHVKSDVEKIMLDSMAGEEIVFDNQGDALHNGKVIGKWQKTSANTYTLATNRKRDIQMKIDGEYLVAEQEAQVGTMVTYYTKNKGAENKKSISGYVYLNKPYRQKTRIYDNGYLYYLFLENGVVYSYVSFNKNVKPQEIIKKGDKFTYKYLNDQILIKSLITIKIEAIDKGHIKTSQDDELIVLK